MLCHYTARYVPIEHGYMGQLVEWPEVVTEGETLEECRAMLQDALYEMIRAHKELGIDVPKGGVLFEQVCAEV